MAVSHQWFVQWSAPPVLITDITSQYNNVNEQWNSEHPKWSDPLGFSDKSEERVNNYSNGDNWLKNHRSVPDRLKNNDSNRAAGITLWLAMLGVVSPQNLPADTDTLPFNTLYKWKQIDFDYPTHKHRQVALATGKYVPANVLPLGLEVWGSRIWVSFPAWRGGVPATLATVPRGGGIRSPLFQPYPNWSFYNVPDDSSNCTKLTSVFRVSADTCGRLWVLDSGQINSQDSPIQVCPPSIAVFDLYTDTLMVRYEIPNEYVLQDSLFSNIIIDSRTPDCSDLHLYIADTWRFGLLVFRERDEKFWKFTHPVFFPDPLASNFSLHGLNFQWTDGILGLALTPLIPFEERSLIFHSMSSHREFFVSTNVLRDPARINNSSSDFKLLGESRGLFGQSSASVTDNRGVMYYGLVTRDSIGCWDTGKPYKKSNMGIVARNTETLIFPNDLKVDQELRQNIWVLSNRLPLFQAGPLDPEDYNYRIMYADIEDAVRGTVCNPVTDSNYDADIPLQTWLP